MYLLEIKVWVTVVQWIKQPSELRHIKLVSMTWLTATEYLCYKLPPMLHLSPAMHLTPFMAYHRVLNQSHSTCATNGAGTAYPFREPEFTSGFQWGSCFVDHGLSFRPFCVVCPSICGFRLWYLENLLNPPLVILIIEMPVFIVRQQCRYPNITQNGREKYLSTLLSLRCT